MLRFHVRYFLVYIMFYTEARNFLTPMAEQQLKQAVLIHGGAGG